MKEGEALWLFTDGTSCQTLPMTRSPWALRVTNGRSAYAGRLQTDQSTHRHEPSRFYWVHLQIHTIVVRFGDFFVSHSKKNELATCGTTGQIQR